MSTIELGAENRATMVRRSFSRAVLMAAWVASLAGCQRSTAGSSGGTGSQTGWLRTCGADVGCEVGDCLCGVCTVVCASDAQCGDVASDARCASGASVGNCGSGSAVENLCWSDTVAQNLTPSGGAGPDAGAMNSAGSGGATSFGGGAGADTSGGGTPPTQIEIDTGDPTLSRTLQSSRDPACTDFEVPETYSFRSTESDPGLRCLDNRADVDLCAGGGDLVSFEYQTDSLFFWINFEPELARGEITEEALRSTFRWFWYEVRFPADTGRPFTSPRVYVEDVNDAEIFSFADGRLHVAASTVVEQITRWVEPEGDCFDDDVGPVTCACDYASELPVRVELDMPLVLGPGEASSANATGLSCDERVQTAAPYVQQALAESQPTCSTVDDCTWVASYVSCSQTCCGYVVSTLERDPLAAKLEAVEVNVCGSFAADGCETPAAPCGCGTIEPQLDCVDGLCVTTP